MPPMPPLEFAVAGFAFASWMEAAFVLAQILPFAFFVFCTLTLWRLLLAAIPARHRLTMLAPPAVYADAEHAGLTPPVGEGRNAPEVLRDDREDRAAGASCSP